MSGVFLDQYRRANVLFFALLTDNANKIGTRQFQLAILAKLVQLLQMNASHGTFSRRTGRKTLILTVLPSMSNVAKHRLDAIFSLLDASDSRFTRLSGNDEKRSLSLFVLKSFRRSQLPYRFIHDQSRG